MVFRHDNLLAQRVIQSEAKNLENIKENVHVDVLEILPPFGRLNDILCLFSHTLFISSAKTQTAIRLRDDCLP